MGITEPQYTTDQRLNRIAWLSARDPHKQFTSLMHHFNVGSLKDCFNELDGKKAVGTDGIDKTTQVVLAGHEEMRKVYRPPTALIGHGGWEEGGKLSDQLALPAKNI